MPTQKFSLELPEQFLKVGGGDGWFLKGNFSVVQTFCSLTLTIDMDQAEQQALWAIKCPSAL